MFAGQLLVHKQGLNDEIQLAKGEVYNFLGLTLVKGQYLLQYFLTV